MDLKEQKVLADRRVVVYEARFSSSGDDNFPLNIAKEWRGLFDTPEMDAIKVNRMKEILDRAKAKQNDYEIAFFGFCNEMEAVHRQLVGEAWQE